METLISYLMTFYVQPRRKDKEEIQDAEVHNMKASLCCEKERKRRARGTNAGEESEFYVEGGKMRKKATAR